MCPLCECGFTTVNNRQIHVRVKHGLSLKNKEIEEMLSNKLTMGVQQQQAEQEEDDNVAVVDYHGYPNV